MIRVDGDRREVSGAMTLVGAAELLAAGSDALAAEETIFDLAAVTEVDSSSLAVIFGWLRAAQRQEKRLRIVNPPQDMLSLAEVYGVKELLPLA